MKAIQSVIENLSCVVGIKQHGTFCGPCPKSDLLSSVESHGLTHDQWGHDWYRLGFQLAHPFVVTLSANFLELEWCILSQPVCNRTIMTADTHGSGLLSSIQQFTQPARPCVFFRIDALTTEDTLFSHGGSDRGEETENSEGCRNPRSETRRLLQESEESRHAASFQRKQEVASQTAFSRLRGDWTVAGSPSLLSLRQKALLRLVLLRQIAEDFFYEIIDPSAIPNPSALAPGLVSIVRGVSPIDPDEGVRQ